MSSSEQPPPPAARWVSFDEARRILGLSEGTLRRAIRAGTVQAEARRRNPDSPTDQRMVYEVLIVDPPAVDMADAPIEAVQAPEAPTDPPDAATRALELLAETSQSLTRQVTEQAETIGTLRAERDVARADLAAARDELARLRERRRWWRWWR